MLDESTTRSSLSTYDDDCEGGNETALHFALSAIGPGFLTLPYGLSQAGLPLFMILLTIAALVSARAVVVILQAKLDSRSKHCPTTYPDLIKRILGRKWAYFTETVIIVNGFGVAISFLIFLGDFATPALQWMLNGHASRLYVILTFALVCVCLSSVPDLGRLKWLSVVPLTGLVWTSGTLLHLLHRDSHISLIWDGLTGLTETKPGWSLLVSLNVCLFAMMMHVNVVPLLKETPTMTRAVLTSSLIKSHASLGIFYLFIALTGCLCTLSYIPDLKTHLAQNFTTNLPDAIKAVLILRIILSLTLLAIAPYQFMAIATSMIELYRRCNSVNSPLKEPLLDDDSFQHHEDHYPIALSTRFLATAILIGSATIAALLTTEVATLLSMVGGFGTTTLMCTLPAMLRWRYSRMRPSPSTEELKSKSISSRWDDRWATSILFAVAGVGYCSSLIIIGTKFFPGKA